jgi:hypothetical protein
MDLIWPIRICARSEEIEHVDMLYRQGEGPIFSQLRGSAQERVSKKLTNFFDENML